MTDYTNLIARLEAAEGPSRELDADIAEALGNPVLRPDPGSSLRYVMWPPEDETYTTEVPAYTASLDAAVSLVPEGKSVDIKIGLTFGAAEIYETRGMKDWQLGFAEAPIPALVLCIAALKAREAENGS